MDNLERWYHNHDFHLENPQGVKGTRRVIWLTLVMMVVEIASGMMFGSMALLADGWHMGTHAAALGITLFAYRYARRHAGNDAFSFGTGKVGILGGYTSAIVLGLVALLMVVESVQRLITPEIIRFDEAILVAVIGLVVNLVSAWLLKDGHHHDHSHPHNHSHTHRHDQNLRAAYLHVIADVLTSVMAIVALLAGKMLGWTWMDPVMGLVGALIIARWAWGLLRETGYVLLDKTGDPELTEKIRGAIEEKTDARVVDLHVWQVSEKHYVAILSVVSRDPQPPAYYKDLLPDIQGLDHITIEVHAYRPR